MKPFLPVLFLTFIVFTALKCKDDTILAGSIEMNLKARFNDQPMILNKIYDYNGKKVRFSKLSFFISDIHNENSSKIAMPIALVHFKDNDDSTTAAKGLNITVNNFDIGNNTQFGFGIGVSSEMNTKKPKDFPSSNPLSEASEFWDAWNSYIFSKLEGAIDKDGDGKFETGITLHTGGNEIYQKINFEKSFSIAENQKAPLNFELNVNKLIDGIDLATVNSTHQTGDLPTMKKFKSNFNTALTIK